MSKETKEEKTLEGGIKVHLGWCPIVTEMLLIPWRNTPGAAMCSAQPVLAVFPWRAEPMPRQDCHRNQHSTALGYRLCPRRHAVHLTGSASVF